MRRGFQVSSLLLHDEVTVAAELAAIGYQCMAIRPRIGHLDPRDDRFSEQMIRLAAAADQHQLMLVIDTEGPFIGDIRRFRGPSLASADQDESDQAFLWIQRWIAVASEFNCHLMTFSTGVSRSGGDEVVLDRLSQRLGELIGAAVEADVQLAVRPVSGDAVATVAQFERLRQWLADSEQLFLAADVAEMLREGEFPVADRLARNLPRLACVYLCEREAQGFRDQVPGQGEIDLKRIVASLFKLGYAGPVVARVDGHSDCGLDLPREALEWFNDVV